MPESNSVPDTLVVAAIVVVIAAATATTSLSGWRSRGLSLRDSLRLLSIVEEPALESRNTREDPEEDVVVDNHEEEVDDPFYGEDDVPWYYDWAYRFFHCWAY